jgi:hypothetical protein
VEVIVVGTLAVALVMAVRSPTDMHVDLRAVGHIEPKGRVQDKDYNPNLAVVDQLVAAGPSAIPFLVSKLEDTAKVKGHVMDYWDDVRVGTVALVVLCDLLLMSDWKTPSVPGFTWDSVLRRGSSDAPSSELFDTFVSKHGRRGLRRRVEELLAPYGGQFTWDEKERCFRPVN